MDALRARAAAAATTANAATTAAVTATADEADYGVGDEAALELRLLRDDLMDEVHAAHAAHAGPGAALAARPAHGGASSATGALTAFRGLGRLDAEPDDGAVAAMVTAQLDRCRALLVEKERELVAAAARANEERERVRAEASRSIAAASHLRHELALKVRVMGEPVWIAHIPYKPFSPKPAPRTRPQAH